jgi:hypothetical protein
MKNNVKYDEKVFFPTILLSQSIESSTLARIESLKKSSGVMVVRGRTLPELTPGSHRFSHGGSTRSELSK